MRTGWKLSEKNYFLLCETLWNKKLQSETVEWGWEFTTDDTENKEGGAEVEVKVEVEVENKPHKTYKNTISIPKIMRTGWKLSEKNYFLLCETLCLLCETLWNKKLQSETVGWGWEFTTDDTENKEVGVEVEGEVEGESEVEVEVKNLL
jgi:hypothetical protein